MIDTADRPAARRTLSVVIRVGSLLLSSGATTDEVELAMRAIARTAGLAEVVAIVQFGTISVSYDPGPDAEPITLIRLVSNKTTDYARLADASALARRLAESRMTVDDAVAEVERIEERVPRRPRQVTWLAAGVSAGGSTVLFGGGPVEVVAAAIATIATQPAIAWLEGRGLPAFFQNVIGPAIATVLVLLLVLAGLPANAPLVVTGAILIFLPGGALAGGMRDLIDGSIVSGTARVFEAILLGAAVGIGVSLGLGIAALWGPSVEFNIPELGSFAIGPQAVAAAVACAAFAVMNSVPRTHILSIAFVGALGLVLQRLALTVGADEIVATSLASIVIGAASRWLAQGNRTSASIWIGAATLPLLPGGLLVEGLLNARAGGGDELVTALIVGFAIGIGCAFGDVLVATIRRINEAIVQPVVVAPAVGLVEEGLSWVSRATANRADPELPPSPNPPASREGAAGSEPGQDGRDHAADANVRSGRPPIR